MCPCAGDEWGRQESDRERVTIRIELLTVVSHLNALVWCVLYDSPRGKALCYVHFADDETMAQRNYKTCPRSNS